MPVRWIKDYPIDETSRNGCSFNAFLEEDYLPAARTDMLKTWYLATIEERYLLVNVPKLREFHQGLFWTAVDRNLAKLNLDPTKRDQVEKQLSEKVPRPSDDWALWGVVCVPTYE